MRLKYHVIIFLNKEKFVDTQCSLSQVSELRSKQSDSSSARLFYSAFLCVLLFGLLHFHSLAADAQLLSLVHRKVVKSLAGRAAVCSSFNLCGWCPRPPAASATSSFNVLQFNRNSYDYKSSTIHTCENTQTNNNKVVVV